MQKQLPDIIDPVRLAIRGQTLKGVYYLSEMERLNDLSQGAESVVSVELHFGVDGNGVRYLKGQASTILNVICQRCLDVMKQPVNVTLSLALLSVDKSAGYNSKIYEPLELGEESLSLKTVVEDEILLALPIAPMHSKNDCSTTVVNGISVDTGKEQSTQDKRPNPFAVLEQLKQKQ